MRLRYRLFTGALLTTSALISVPAVSIVAVEAACSLDSAAGIAGTGSTACVPSTKDVVSTDRNPVLINSQPTRILFPDGPVSVVNNSALNNSTLMRVLSSAGPSVSSIVVNGDFTGQQNASGTIHSGLDAAGQSAQISIRGNASITSTQNTSAIRTGRGGTGGRVDVEGTLSVDTRGRGIDARTAGSVVNVGGKTTITSSLTALHAQSGAKIYVKEGAGQAAVVDENSMIVIDGVPVRAKVDAATESEFGFYAWAPLGAATVLVNSPGGLVQTAGDRGHGIIARAGSGNATISLQDGAVETGVDGRGTGAHGLYVHANNGSGDAIASLSGGAVTTSGNEARGVYALTEAGTGRSQALIRGGRISTTGEDAHGVQALTKGQGALIELDGGTVFTAGDNSEGLYSHVNEGSSAATVVIRGGTVSTSGRDADGAVALVSDNSIFGNLRGNATIDMSGGLISTSGAGSAGLVAQTDISLLPNRAIASVTQSGGTIRTSGDAQGTDLSAGIVSVAASLGRSEVVQSGGLIETAGQLGHGIYAAAGGSVSVRQAGAGIIHAQGTDAYGIRVVSQAPSSEGGYNVFVSGRVTGGSGRGAGISVSGQQGLVYVDREAVVSSASGVAIVDEPGALGTQNGSLTVRNTGFVDGDILTGEGDDVVYLLGGSRTRGAILLDNGTRNGSDSLGILAGADISGVTLLDGGDDVFDADGTVDKLAFVGGLYEAVGENVRNFEQLWLESAGLRLSGSSLRIGSGDAVHDNFPMGMTISSDSVLWIQPDVFAITGNVTNAGLLSLENGSANGRLQLAADAEGVVGTTGIFNGLGGSVLLEAVLGDDASPSDRLIIDGGAVIGRSQLAVTNLGGVGALTQGDGILLVDASNGTTRSDSFGLANVVMGGPFEYRLFRSGADAGTINNWYLRSTDTRPPTPPTPPTDPTQPSPPLPPENSDPIIRSEIPAYGLATELLYRMGIVEVGTFNDRRGARSFLRQDGEEGVSPAWARAYGQANRFGSDAVLSGTDFNIAPRFDGSIAGFQAGADIWGSGDENGNTHRAGLFYSGLTGFGSTYGHVRAQQDIYAGRLSLNAHGLGAYYTYTGAGGFYLDAVGIVSAVNGVAQSSTGVSAPLDGLAFTASIEIGQDIQLAEGWTLQPQGQLIWRKAKLNGTHDGVSDIDMVDISEFTARLGLRLENRSLWNEREVVSHVGVNLWQRSDHANAINVGTMPITGGGGGGTSLELNAGIAMELNEHSRVFGGVSYTSALDGSVDNSFAVRAGFKVSF